MQTLEQFIDDIDVPGSLLEPLEIVQGFLKSHGNKPMPFYMCNRMGIHGTFAKWINNVIQDNVPFGYMPSVNQRGILALFHHKGWLLIDHDRYANPSDEEYIMSNKLRLEFVQLSITKIKKDRYV